MKEYDESDFLPLSSMMHFAYCKRRWALIHIEQQWQENLQTTQGHIMHEVAHGGLDEKRGDLVIARAVPVFSRTLGLRGECDVVEWRASSDGVPLPGRVGLWLPCPIEYKSGAPGENVEADSIQLCAQCMCLEEMLCTRIDRAYLFYGKIHRRMEVMLDETQRKKVQALADDMHACYDRRHTPRVKSQKRCRSCSLADICLPKLQSSTSAIAYICSMITEDSP